MTHSLEKAIAKVEKLPTEQQDAIATLILEELEDEARWDAAFAGSHDLLAELAAEAEEEDRADLTEALDPKSL